MKSHEFLFPGVRGIQANKEFYIIMCPLELIPEIFANINLPTLPTNLRAQRILNKGRVPAIKRYILENPDSYVFSSITVSVDGDFVFEPIDKRNYQIGYLKISKDAKFVINDGQHRIEAIKQALTENPLLKYENISIVVFIDLGLERSQQLFTDLNRFSVKPTPSISILYDYRDNLAELSRFLAENVYCFQELVEYEKSTISNRSNKLFTLSSIYHANMELLGKKGKSIKISEEEKDLAFIFWEHLGKYIKEWNYVREGKLKAYEARQQYVHSHGLFLNAIAIVGRKLIEMNYNLEKQLSKLTLIDFSRQNQVWEGIALNNGRLSKAYINVIKTAEFLEKHLLDGETLCKEDRKNLVESI